MQRPPSTGCERRRRGALRDSVKHDSEDKQTGYWQFECSSCMRNKIATLRAKNERMMQDHIRLCTAVGLDADAHIDMLAEAAERLRAECERLKARGIEGMQYRIEELEAALIAIDLLSSQGFAPALTEIGKIAAAALKESN